VNLQKNCCFIAINPEIISKYNANRLRIMRQVHYSLDNQNSIDLVLFLNGLPIATVELKTDFTQSIEDAMDQYRFDRSNKSKKRSVEPLLSFPNGALVHFAVSNMEVYMTTKLEGPKTCFLPFNKGNNSASGNPVNPQGHRTAYLWEEIWARDSWLEILGRYLVAHRDSKKQIKNFIFPRYHQLDATRKLLASVSSEGAGGKYLIQHSAGSGKTNSIAWTAHFLADLHDSQNQKVFDSVLVVSDRNVIDTQLQEAIFNFERTTGVVATIKGKGTSKSSELAKALSGKKKIVVCTIQTFPHALKAVQELAAAQGKRFVVIADEAHSSQTGQASAKLKTLLSAEEIKELDDGGSISTEDLLVSQMGARIGSKNITYIAFTATPKAKTLELFGRRPHPDRTADKDNLPLPFHVYSMRQAIEEKFILDVLKNYTPYKLAFKLAHKGQEIDERSVERGEAMKGIMRWVKLHPYNISQKVQVVVEHFRENIQSMLSGYAKAMVVVSSRLEAVRWQLAIDKYIKSQGYDIGTLVAFSGEVSDKESSPEPFTESSKKLNPNLKGRNISEAFDTDEYQVLLVANKFQTGFDQPLLCGMYVDKRLGGIQAVQTLSRLNRSYSGQYGLKDTTYVLDFVNDENEILNAFKTYYDTAELENVTDPNLIYNLRAKLDALGYYDDFEIEQVVTVVLKLNVKQSELLASLGSVVDRLLKRYKETQERKTLAVLKKEIKETQEAQSELDSLVLFKRDMRSFLNMYSFLSQIFDYGNTALEKRFIFYKYLLPLLEFGRERESIDFSKLNLTHHALRGQGKRTLPVAEGDSPKLAPITDLGAGAVQEKEKALLDEIITKVNDLFEGELSDDDKLVYVNNVIKRKLLESETLVEQAANNTKEQFANSPDLANGILNAIIDALDAHSIMSKQALGSEKVRNGMKDVLLGPAHLYEALKERASTSIINV
jgi:type I restriction enzyme, R subunit